MTRQELIKQSYGNCFGLLKNTVIDNDGFCHDFSKKDLISKKIDLEIDSMARIFRPKILKQKLNNNNWIKIESENDLPNIEDELYFVNGENCSIHQCVFHDGIKEYWLENFTHYQPIIKPNEPLY